MTRWPGCQLADRNICLENARSIRLKLHFQPTRFVAIHNASLLDVYECFDAGFSMQAIRTELPPPIKTIVAYDVWGSHVIWLITNSVVAMQRARCKALSLYECEVYCLVGFTSIASWEETPCGRLQCGVLRCTLSVEADLQLRVHCALRMLNPRLDYAYYTYRACGLHQVRVFISSLR